MICRLIKIFTTGESKKISVQRKTYEDRGRKYIIKATDIYDKNDVLISWDDTWKRKYLDEVKDVVLKSADDYINYLITLGYVVYEEE